MSILPWLPHYVYVRHLCCASRTPTEHFAHFNKLLKAMSSLCIARVRTSKHLSAYSTDVLSHVVQLDNKGFDNKESDYKAAFAHSTFDNKAFDAQAVDNKAFDNLRRRLDKTAITTCEVSESWDNESELNFMMTPKRKLRILMLHGTYSFQCYARVHKD